MNYLIVMLVVILMINVSIILCMQMIFASWHLLALQNLLDTCHNYGAANDILFNPLKSVCIVYKPKYLKKIFGKPLRLLMKRTIWVLLSAA